MRVKNGPDFLLISYDWANIDGADNEDLGNNGNLGQNPVLFHWMNIFSLTISHQETIKLIKTVVFVNPFDEVDAVVS